MDSKVSVIIPVYNVEKYIRRCLDSVMHQSYKNIEVILVDDGSTDNCGAICDEYAERYANIIVIHQSNQGQSVARNNAVKISTGEFITFIDSDDFVTEDYVEYLVALQSEINADISIGGFRYHYEGNEAHEPKDETKVVRLNKEEAIERMNYTRGYGAVPWAKLYRRQLIVEHPFPEGQIYEDLAVLYKIVNDSERIIYGNKEIYYWLQREGSIMHLKFSDRQMAALDATKAQVAYMEERLPSVLPSAKARHEAKIAELMSIAMKSENSKESYKKLKSQSRYSKEVLKNKSVKRTQKIKMIGIKLGYIPTKIMYTLHERMKKAKFS